MLKKLRTKLRLKKALVAEQHAKQVTHFDESVIDWRTPEYDYYEKGKIWFAVFAAVLSLFAIYAIWSKDYFFLAAIITFGVVYIMLQKEKPKNIKVIISKYGIKVGQESYAYSQMQAFWIIYRPPYVKTLNLRMKNSRFAQDVVINLQTQDPSEVRELLGSLIPEWQGKRESFIENFARMLRL